HGLFGLVAKVLHLNCKLGNEFLFSYRQGGFSAIFTTLRRSGSRLKITRAQQLFTQAKIAGEA
ncbi:hypothetical protein, partial [Lacticaseibacillus camelliae]|uniref:hypothetical protein n=1 Tax=Lacticaseibacillus camelliae TaxID=381742 RepID=UPI001F38C81C